MIPHSLLGHEVMLPDSQIGIVWMEFGGPCCDPEDAHLDGVTLIVAVERPRCSACPHGPVPPLLVHVRASEVIL